jgi:hypothetical protein
MDYFYYIIEAQKESMEENKREDNKEEEKTKEKKILDLLDKEFEPLG